jgi:hypothetical protein
VAYNELLRNNQQSTVLTIEDATAGTVVAGPTLLMSNVEKGTLSARCTVEAETSTITLSAVWELSDDGTTWRQARGLSNATPVVLATGTGGDDAAVVRNVDAPTAVYATRYVRCSILVGTATGAAVDLATVAYDYAQNQGL